MSGQLTNSTAEVVRALLISLGLGNMPLDNSAVVNPILVSMETETPDELTTIYDTPGIVDARRMNDGLVVEKSGIQLRVRGTVPPTTYARASALVSGLDLAAYPLVVSVTVASVTKQYSIQNVSRKGTINNLGREQKSNRPVFTVNYVVCVKQLN